MDIKLTAEEILSKDNYKSISRNYIKKFFKNKPERTVIETLENEWDAMWLLTKKDVLPDEIMQEWFNYITDYLIAKYCVGCGYLPIEIWANDWLNCKDRSKKAATKIHNIATKMYDVNAFLNAALDNKTSGNNKWQNIVNTKLSDEKKQALIYTTKTALNFTKKNYYQAYLDCAEAIRYTEFSFNKQCTEAFKQYLKNYLANKEN